MRTVYLLDRVAGGSDRLTPNTAAHDSTGLPLELAAYLDGVTLGTWAFGVRALGLLISLVEQVQPRLVIEFGSGASTLCLAWALRRGRDQSVRARVVALEQDPEHAGFTRLLVERAGLTDHAVVLDAPIIPQLIGGVQTNCYSIPPALAEIATDAKASLIVIDGPAGEAGIRYGTLPLAVPFASADAIFVLDDALRHGELGILRRWQGLTSIRVDGVVPIEHGMALGRVVTTMRFKKIGSTRAPGEG
jgi:hypothetical protein